MKTIKAQQELIDELREEKIKEWTGKSESKNYDEHWRGFLLGHDIAIDTCINRIKNKNPNQLN